MTRAKEASSFLSLSSSHIHHVVLGLHMYIIMCNKLITVLDFTYFKSLKRINPLLELLTSSCYSFSKKIRINKINVRDKHVIEKQNSSNIRRFLLLDEMMNEKDILSNFYSYRDKMMNFFLSTIRGRYYSTLALPSWYGEATATRTSPNVIR